MKGRGSTTRYVLCVKNEGYPASLEVRKIYQTIADPVAAKRGLVRVLDESGEDYLYPKDYFVSIAVPKTARKVLAEQRIESMLREGVARWKGGKPHGSSRPPRVKGPSVAETVIKDRR